MELRKKLGKGTLVLIGIIAVMATALGAVLITRTYNYSGRIITSGDFALYTDQALTIPFTGYDFGNYTVLTDESKMTYAWIKSKGNTDTNMTWTSNYFTTVQDNTLKNTAWVTWIDLLNTTVWGGGTAWYPSNATGTPLLTKFFLAKGASTCIRVGLRALASSPPETLAFIQTISQET